MLKAVIFDLDDTLCDDSGAWLACARAAARLAGGAAEPTERLAQTFLAISERYWTSAEPPVETRPIAQVRGEQWREALEAATPGRAVPAGLAERLAGEYGRRRSADVALFPDALPTLARLRQAGLQLVLMTNGLVSTHLEKIERLALAPAFDHVLVAGQLGVFKPDPRIFAEALRACGCRADEAAMVGDDLVNDIGGAESAGIATYWYNPGRRLHAGAPSPRPSGGEIAALAELPSLLIERA